MLTKLIPSNFKHIPEISIYDHNIYSDGKIFIKENYDECFNCYSYEEVDKLGKFIKYLGMSEDRGDRSIFTDSFVFIGKTKIDYDLSEEVVLNSNYY